MKIKRFTQPYAVTCILFNDYKLCLSPFKNRTQIKAGNKQLQKFTVVLGKESSLDNIIIQLKFSLNKCNSKMFYQGE